ncbi:MAG: hypothetical protein R3F62_13375 [Planctomycetota bacterium]
MKFSTASLALALCLGSTAAFAEDLSEQEIARRFAAQVALSKEKNLAQEVAKRFGMSSATLDSNGVDGANGATIRGNGTEVRMLRFDSQEAADNYLVHGDLEQIVPHPMVFEQRGNYVAVVSGEQANDPAAGREALREVWNAEVTANGNHLIPPVRTRAAYVGDQVVIESAIEDPAFVESFDNAEYSGIPTEHSDGIRRMYIGEGAEDLGQGYRITPADTSPLRSRGDEGQLGRTRGLSLGGNASGGNAGAARKGLGDLLQGN